jgi:hypothetical protein
MNANVPLTSVATTETIKAKLRGCMGLAVHSEKRSAH